MIDVLTKTAEQLAREDVERQALEAAARKIEGMAGSEVYQRAWKRASEIVRSMKP